MMPKSLLVCLVLASVGLSAALQSRTVKVYESEDCSSSYQMVLLDETSPWLSVCANHFSGVRSIMIEDGTSLAPYFSCRAGLDDVQGPDISFDSHEGIITAPEGRRECIKIVSDGDESNKRVSFQLVDSMRAVCLEYARTALHFCDADECSKSCVASIDAMRYHGLNHTCRGVDVMSMVRLYEDDDSEVESSSNWETESESETESDSEFQKLVAVKQRPHIGQHGGQGGVVRPGHGHASQQQAGSHASQQQAGSHASQQQAGSSSSRSTGQPSRAERMCYYKLAEELTEEFNEECAEGNLLLFVLCTTALLTSIVASCCLCCNGVRRRQRSVSPEYMQSSVILSPDMTRDGPTVQAVVINTNGKEVVHVVCSAV